MNKGRVIAIFVSIALALVVLAFVFWPSTSDEKEIQWTEYYHMDYKEPYGTYAISKLLDNYFPKQNFTVLKEPVHKALPSGAEEKLGNYVCVSDYIYWSPEDEDSLLAFVAKGNNAFISAKELPTSFLNKLSSGSFLNARACNHFYSKSDLRLKISDGSDSSYNCAMYRYGKKDTSYLWSGISVSLDSVIYSKTLGTYEKVEADTTYVNFVKMQFGEGTICFHTVPLALTNYFVITPSGREYAEKVFSFLPEGDIYWDDYSQINADPESEEEDKKSPLSFILSQKSLRWAYYICLLAVVLYIVFRAKRKQRIIPVIEPNTNTSIMFIETIGKLYYMQNNHRKVAQLKMKHFIHFIRTKYKVNLQKDMEQKVDQLAFTSGVDKEIISSLFTKYNRIHLMENITAHELLEFNSIIQNFYKNCK
ncbi:MAG: hypothetical protein NT150_00925 [Bacteroidetes bacterium]|nr:hypothetical protein [Bacteroidota bacterium]